MQDIPLFTTEYGAASLVLREIPYRQRAYIHLQASLEPEKLLAECVQFARMAGAEEILACGDAVLEKYPLHTQILRLSRLREGLGDTDAALFPVTEETLEIWRSLYNERMQNVDQAAFMSMMDAKKLLGRKNGYFIHRGGQLLGIGIAAGETIEAIASAKPGCGKQTLLALNHALSGEKINVEVASTNENALRLYNALGFVPTAVISQWYKVI